MTKEIEAKVAADFDKVYETEYGFHPLTLQKYVDVWGRKGNMRKSIRYYYNGKTIRIEEGRN